jgi:YD repeat-containing protein
MESGDGREITWDAENRPASITKDQITTYFTYDGDGNRVKQTVGDVTTIYVNKYYEKTGDNVTTSYYPGQQADSGQDRRRVELSNAGPSGQHFRDNRFRRDGYS